MVDNVNKNHHDKPTINNSSFLDQFCRYVHEGEFQQAERFLIEFLESTINHSNGRVSLEGKKALIKQIYYNFDKIYSNWLTDNKLSGKKDKLTSKVQKHNNHFIAHSSIYEEMDDLLYALIEYDNSDQQKEEMKYNLGCYKKQLLD